MPFYMVHYSRIDEMCNVMIRAKHWLNFIGNWLLSSTNDQEVIIERYNHIGCIMINVYVNIRERIAKMVKMRAKQLGTLLPFPILISMLCFPIKSLLFLRYIISY